MKAQRVLPLTPRTWEVVRFLATGALNTAFGYVLFAGFVLTGLPSPAALALATVIGVCFNFFSYGKLAFRRLGLARLPRFLAIYAALYLLNLALLLALERGAGLDPLVAQALCLIVIVPTTYVLLKRKVYGD